MKTHTRFKLIVPILLALFVFFETANAANITVFDSVISLATNVTKNYTFTDSSSGQNVTIAVTMTPYSESNASPVFTVLDGNTHAAINSGLNDGNWIDVYEGLNFSASLVSASSDVSASSVQFGIVGIGLRSEVGFPTNTWTSSATATSSFQPTSDNFYVLDFAQASLSGGNYFGHLRSSSDGQYQLNDGGTLAEASIEFSVSFTVSNSVFVDPRTNCWFITDSGKYARIYTNDAMKSAGITLTNWAVGTMIQSNVVYCGVQEIYSSTNWIYVRSTGLASYTMGPWYLNSGRVQMFPNLPTNQKLLFRFPRTNGVPATKSLNGGGQIGIFVDGVEMFNSWDGYTWSTVSNVDAQNITGYWNRDAYVNEGVTFDAGYAHQQQGGTFHYHADPIALRYQLGDHVDYDAATKTYSEDTNAPTKHSPILAWTADGYPLYGPYGYSNATNANSGIRRMISGYVIRNGSYGTDDLSHNGAARSTIPQWAVRLYTNNISANQPGPNVSSGHPLGDYMEDNDYLGDLINSNTGTNYQQGVDFDLDEYNGCWCVTPEFPGGTYAYFVAIDSNGTPVFPYDIGRAFRGDPVGGSVVAITENVVTNFLGGTNLTSTLNSPVVKNGTVTLSWSAIEGGKYQVEATTNLSDSSSWTIVSTGNSPPPNQVAASYTNVTSLDKQFYRVGRTSVATYDSAGTTIFATNSVAPGGNAYRGQSVVLTITLPGSPPNPPVGAPISSVTIGGITASSASYTTAGTVTAVFTIPSNYTPTGSQNVTVQFNPNPSYTLTGGFTINP